MRSRHLLQLGLLVAAVFLGVGCLDDGEQPKYDIHHFPPDAGPITLSPPVLDLGAIPQTTCQSEVGIIGTTQPGYNVFAEGGAGSGIIAANSSGRFCLPVRLNTDQINTINVYVADPAGGTSEAATVTVTHRTSPECQTPTLDGGVAPDPENVALGAEATSMEPPNPGTTNALIDGDPSTWALWTYDTWLCPTCAYDGWVSLKLEQPTSISKIVLRWRDDYNAVEKYFASKYKILVSSTPAAGDPQEGGVWTTLETIPAGDGGEDIFEFKDVQPIALHVAVWLEFDGESSYYERFALSEIEVYDTPASTSQPPPPPGVCAGAF